MREKAYGNDLSLLWNTLVPFEVNAVTKEEAVYFHSFDMNELRDIEQVFDLFIKGSFLSSGSEKQNEVLKAISRLLQADRQVLDDFFAYDFGFATIAPKDYYLFLQHVFSILSLYLLSQKKPAVSYGLDKAIYTYPEAFYKLVDLNLVNFDVWYLLDSESALTHYQGLQVRYPERRLIPFARRDDCDDLACFEIGKSGRVQLIHDFANSGWEQRKEFQDLWEWLEAAVGDMIIFNKEEGIY